MKFNIHGKKLDVTESIKSYIEEKIGRLDKYFENPNDIITTAVIKLRGKDQVVEITINTNKFLLRGEESHKDLYAAIDKVSDKIERQIRKNKTRMSKKVNMDLAKGFILDFDPIDNEEDRVIVKRKIIENKPMNEEEAILQMELLGHEFFAFRNVETNNVNIIYKRKDGDYGIMEIK